MHAGLMLLISLRTLLGLKWHQIVRSDVDEASEEDNQATEYYSNNPVRRLSLFGHTACMTTHIHTRTQTEATEIINHAASRVVETFNVPTTAFPCRSDTW